MYVLKFISISYVLIALQSIFVNCLDRNSECITPIGETAVCKSIFQCPILFDKIYSKDANEKQFLKKSQCGYDGDFLVCCGTKSNYEISEKQSDFGDINTISCGIQETNYIYGGEDAQMDEFPWLALLQYQSRGGRKDFLCGGNLISKKYVLTAAHCLTTALFKLIKVRLGEWNTQTDKDCINVGNTAICNSKPLDMDIAKTIVHHKYNVLDKNAHNDIGLIELEGRVEYTNFIRPICLPPPEENIKVGDKLTVAGWGKTTEEQRLSNIKKKVVIPFYNRDACAKKFATRRLILGDGQICAGGEINRDSCSGDSGGPLMKTSTNSLPQWYVTGIVSLGRACGIEGWPGIYTKVSFYLDWIYNNTKND